MSVNGIPLSQFTSYADCPSQYSSLYIRSSCAVKTDETDTQVYVSIARSRYEDTGAFLRQIHAPREVVFDVVSDGDFAEFIGNVIDAGRTDATEERDETGFALDKISASSPAVNVINAICLEALRRGASDIHIEAAMTETRIRYRIDGVLQTVKKLDKSIFPTISSRIKIMSNLNIMEQRLPQDGRMRVVIGEHALDFRVSTVPVAFGESIVLRIFNTDGEIPRLGELGFSPAPLESLLRSVLIPNGLILATGPTGSGKTTTLHALLGQMNGQERKIITIEDPVERVLPDVNQIQVNDEIALSFDTMLRRVLRQDPNVIMIGEIRDTVTAELALRAALTGHVILSTLHTNDSISAIGRLRNMGIEPYLIASVLRFALAQRLVRKICPHCARETAIPPDIRELRKKYDVPGDSMLIETGCEKCGFTGYAGRTVVAEVFEVDESIERMISGGQPSGDIARYAREQGMASLACDALKKLFAGSTSLSEIRREAIL